MDYFYVTQGLIYLNFVYHDVFFIIKKNVLNEEGKVEKK